jgi:peptidoglycan/xylan/chitin deacetylase (PgdA/CDA1 family)
VPSDTPAPTGQAADRHPRRRLGLVVAALGVVVACAGVGTALLLRTPTHRASAPPPVRHAVRPARRHRHRRRVSAAVLDARAVERLAALGLPVYCGGSRGRDVALTFDDGPGVYTHLALQALRRAGARATFFLVGRNLARWPGFVRPEAALGALGDHTWTHAFLPPLPRSVMMRQLADTQAAIAAESSRPVLLFRPPYGGRNSTIDAAAHSLGMLEVLWSVDSLDWKGATWRQIAANVAHGARPGSIVLMHENHGQTIRSLRNLVLPFLRAHRLQPVSVPQLLRLDPPSDRQLRAGLAGCRRGAA